MGGTALLLLVAVAAQDAPPDEMQDRAPAETAAQTPDEMQDRTPDEAPAPAPVDPETPAPAAARCIPGASQACACVDGRQGAQLCRADGLGLEACVCRANAGPPPSPPAAVGEVEDHEDPAGPGDAADPDELVEDAPARSLGTAIASAFIPGLGQFLVGEPVAGGVHLATGIGTMLAFVLLTPLSPASFGALVYAFVTVSARNSGGTPAPELQRLLLVGDVAFYAWLLTAPLTLIGLASGVTAGVNWIWSIADAAPPFTDGAE